MRIATSRRVLAVLALATVLAAGCSTSKKTANSNSSNGAQITSAQGVTAGTVKIGFSYPDLEALAKTGLIKTDNGPYPTLMKAIVDDVNAHGGINGRKLALVTQKFSILDATNRLAVCTKFTEDVKVFAVLGGFNDINSSLCVVQQHATLLVGGYGGGFDAATLAKARAPWATWYPSTERSIDALVQLLDHNGEIKGKTIALYGQTQGSQPLIDIATKSLETAGYHVTTSATNNTPISDTSAFNAQEKVIGQRFKDAHVDAVIVLNGTVPGTNFDAIDFHPSIFLPSTDLITPAAFTNPLGKFPLIAGPAPSANPDAGFNTPTMRHCRDVWKQTTGKDIKTQAEEQVLGTTTGNVGMSFACSSLAIFVAAAKAAGANLTDATWEKGLESIGSLPLPNAPVCSFGPNKPDCQDSFQLEKFNPAWKPNSSTPQYIPIGQPLTRP